MKWFTFTLGSIVTEDVLFLALLISTKVRIGKEKINKMIKVSFALGGEPGS